jgi:hypothetical protein
MQPVTPGYRTSEFWISLAAMLVGAILASGALPEHTIAFKIVGVAATILGALGYTVSRTMVKSAYLAPLPPPAQFMAPAPAPAALAEAQAAASVAAAPGSATDLADRAAQ